MNNLTISQIIEMYERVSKILQPLGSLTLSLFPNVQNLPNMITTDPTEISPIANKSDITHKSNEMTPQYYYSYPVFKNYSPSENRGFFNIVNPNIFGSATVNSMQEMLNKITEQYSLAMPMPYTAENTSAISTVFAENTDFSNAFSTTNSLYELHENRLNSDVFQNSAVNENPLQRTVLSSHRGEELRQAVKSTQPARGSSVYNGGAEIRVDMSGMHNTVNSRADMDELIDRLCSELSQTALSAAEGVSF